MICDYCGKEKPESEFYDDRCVECVKGKAVVRGDIFVHKNSGRWYAAVEDGETDSGMGFKLVVYRPYDKLRGKDGQ